MEELKEQNAIETTKGSESRLIFKHFPKYAAYVRENFLVPYIQEQLKLSHELHLPMLKYFSQYTDEQLIELGKEGHSAYLTAIAENNGKEYLDISLKSVEKHMGIALQRLRENLREYLVAVLLFLLSDKF